MHTFMRRLFKPVIYPLIVCLLHNPFAALYFASALILFQPFPAIADVFLDKAAEGQDFGTAIRDEFRVPSVNKDTGTITLQNGLVDGQKIKQNELFQEIQPGSIDDALSSYGDNEALNAYTNTFLDDLQDNESQHANSYNTLLNSRTSNISIYNDPIWKSSDDVLSRKSPLIDSLFTSCETTNTAAASAAADKNCYKHIPEYEYCEKVGAPQQCKVERIVEVIGPPLIQTGGDGYMLDSNPTTTLLSLGPGVNGAGTGCPAATYTMNIKVLDETRLSDAVLYHAVGDDGIAFYIDDQLILSRGGCENIPAWQDGYNIPVLSYLTNGVHKLKLIVYTGGETQHGDGRVDIKITKTMDIKETFVDDPPGCRQRIFDAWPLEGDTPPFDNTGSPEAEASTAWWACTDAAYSRFFDGIEITNTDYGPLIADILPEPPDMPPAPICYKAKTRVPQETTFCWTDPEGVEHCTDYQYGESDTCGEYADNPQCAYIGEECLTVDPATGECQAWKITYDCGEDQEVPCDDDGGDEETLCDAQLRCMGTECLSPAYESNQDFTEAAASLAVLNQAQQDADCQTNASTCEFFKGDPFECKKALGGYVDCCEKVGNVSWGDYMEMAYDTYQLADTVASIAYSSAEFGASAWESLALGDTDILAQYFMSGVDTLLETAGIDIIEDVVIGTVKDTLLTNLENWMMDTFGQAALDALVELLGEAVVSAIASAIAAVVTIVGILYLIYTIIKIIIQIIWACEESEYELSIKRQLKDCHYVGTYCKSKFLGFCVEERDAFCCFSSPFSRIFQEQARLQLPRVPWGTAKLPNCRGLLPGEIAGLDFDRMDFGEWIGMLASIGKIPTNKSAAETLYQIEPLSVSHLPGAAAFDIYDRVQTQTENIDMEQVRETIKSKY